MWLVAGSLRDGDNDGALRAKRVASEYQYADARFRLEAAWVRGDGLANG